MRGVRFAHIVLSSPLTGAVLKSQPMPSHQNSDYLQSYEQALAALKARPDDLSAKHQAVLMLARMGSLGFAVSEYARYGLDEIRNHEDIMALGARLSKDLYLASSGKAALEHARDSAAKYEAAFQATKGFYSGINAATMALMADMPRDMVLGRVQSILDILPDAEGLNPEDHYFVEATRAECFLVQGDIEKARLSLRGAIKFDPLNYAAHATTLKQFRLILKARGQDAYWLKEFTPPRAVHFAGHIWDSSLTPLTHAGDKLETALSDKIQAHDIGYGYGALAAGADIIIAEGLLNEGAQLHVILPCKSEDFIAQSVAPFGASWVTRYKDCLEGAASLTELEGEGGYLQSDMQLLAGRVAMGQAIIKSRHFDNHAAQALLWDRARAGSMTEEIARQWQYINLEHIILPLSGLPEKKSETSSGQSARHKSIAVKMIASTTGETMLFETLDAALQKAMEMTAEQRTTIALAFDLKGSDDRLARIFAQSPAGSILVTEAVAGCVMVSGTARAAVTFAGSLLNDGQPPLRCYTLSAV